MKKLILLLLLIISSPNVGVRVDACNMVASLCNVIKKGMRFLFIGDSITDGGWGRSGGNMMPTEQRNQKDLNHICGHSFMMLCAARVQSDYPDQETLFFNRGISGNTTAPAYKGGRQQRAFSLSARTFLPFRRFLSPF